jgi:hypothetical protein
VRRLSLPVACVFRDPAGCEDRRSWPAKRREAHPLPGCRKVRRGADSCQRGGDPPTDASKLQQLTGRIASRSGTLHAEKRTKALIPYDPVASLRSDGRRAFPGVGSAAARGGRGFGIAAETSASAGICASAVVDRRGPSDRLEGSKKIEKTGGSAFSTVRLQGTCRFHPRRFGHRKSKPIGSIW